jgi:hypothetical protein
MVDLCVFCREADTTVNPVQEMVVQKLRAAFGQQALFFWDGCRGDVVGVKWRPSVLQPSSFAILSCNDRSVTDAAADGSANAATVPNIPELLTKMLDLSDGLIVSVTTNA